MRNQLGRTLILMLVTGVAAGATASHIAWNDGLKVGKRIVYNDALAYATTGRPWKIRLDKGGGYSEHTVKVEEVKGWNRA